MVSGLIEACLASEPDTCPTVSFLFSPHFHRGGNKPEKENNFPFQRCAAQKLETKSCPLNPAPFTAPRYPFSLSAEEHSSGLAWQWLF